VGRERKRGGHPWTEKEKRKGRERAKKNGIRHRSTLSSASAESRRQKKKRRRGHTGRGEKKEGRGERTATKAGSRPIIILSAETGGEGGEVKGKKKREREGGPRQSISIAILSFLLGEREKAEEREKRKKELSQRKKKKRKKRKGEKRVHLRLQHAF